MALDTRSVVRPGEQGLKTQTIRITYEDGEEIDREVVDETVLTPPVSEIVDYGTSIVWQTVDTPEGPLRYWRKLRMYATSYSASRAGTPRSAPWYGMTRLGWEVVRGVVATDPRIVPLRTHLYVPGYGPAVAADTGGGVRNYMIDLGFEDDKYESWHEWLDVYLVEPLPDENDIRWVMP
jgi:3D (Asp-Asp-Asp) domain-containing protein